MAARRVAEIDWQAVMSREVSRNGGKDDGLGKSMNAVSISERPASVEDGAQPGHGEGDLIAGSNGSHIATLFGRNTRYVLLAKVDSKDTEIVFNALMKQAHLSVHAQARLNAVARQLNERQRKTLGFRTPAARYSECFTSTR